MTQTASPASAMSDRLALIIEGLCGAVARRVGPRIGFGGIAGPLIILIWSRLRRIATRFTRAATSSPTPFRPQAIITAKRPPRPRQPRPHLLPRRKAWLLRLVPETSAGASQLRHFLADPEIAGLLATAPQLHRALRPLCHMLGIRAAGIRLMPATPQAAAAPAPCLPRVSPPSAALTPPLPARLRLPAIPPPPPPCRERWRPGAG
ncbi:MAG TPA: hypothetical protein VFN77_04940 [Acetobacteraceae bacterium]|nr:hypothetical protein [Acetobacteraceae bacterium]